jgi:hypothetical protein
MFLFNLNNSSFHKISFFLLLIVFSQNTYSLSFKVKGIANNIVDTKSKAFSAFKVLKLERGKTDLIFEGDHYKFFKDGKFLFRGLCFKSDDFNSIWVLYNHFSKGTNFQEVLVGQRIKNYLVPRRIRNLLNIIRSNISFYESQFVGKLKRAKEITSNSDDSVIKVLDGQDLKLDPNEFVQSKTEKKAVDELEKYKLTLDIGPIVINTNPNTINSAFGFSFSCLYCTDKKYYFRYNFFHQTQEPRREDFGDNTDLISSNFHEALGHIEWVRVFENLSFYSRLYGNRVKTSDQLNGQSIYSPEHLVRITPLALRFHLLNKIKNVDSSIGIGPSYSFERFQFNDAGNLGIDQGNKLRWSFNFYLKWSVTKNFSLMTDSWFHPLSNGEGGSFDVYDSGPSRFNLSGDFSLTDSFSVSFLSELFWNGLQKRREDLPSSNFVNSLKVHYSFDF